MDSATFQLYSVHLMQRAQFPVDMLPMITLHRLFRLRVLQRSLTNDITDYQNQLNKKLMSIGKTKIEKIKISY